MNFKESIQYLFAHNIDVTCNKDTFILQHKYHKSIHSWAKTDKELIQYAEQHRDKHYID